MADLERRIATAKKRAVDQRNYRRIRDRALRRLGNLYPDQYRELFEEERERDEEENKVWLDLDGRTHASLGKPTRHRDPLTQRRSNNQPESNEGGEG